MTIQELIDLTQEDINQMTTKELRKAIGDLGSRANRNIEEIRNAGLDKYELGRFLNRKQIKEKGFKRASEITSANVGRNQLKLLKLFYQMPHTVKQQLKEQEKYRKQFLQSIGKVPIEEELLREGYSKKEINRIINVEMDKYSRSYNYIDSFMDMYNKAAEEKRFSDIMDKVKYEKFREEAYDFFEKSPEFKDDTNINKWSDVKSENQWGDNNYANDKAQFIDNNLSGLLDHQKVMAYNTWNNPIERLYWLAVSKMNDEII